MTVAQPTTSLAAQFTPAELSVTGAPDLGRQRFQFTDVDWAFYETISRQLDDRHVFATYHKGRLELVTVSPLHEVIVALLAAMVRALAEETGTPLGSAGSATLRRPDLNEAVEPDSSFYIANAGRMRGKQTIDLQTDPPPDLAIEVEVTQRLGERKSIYRDLGVPEVWQYGATGLTILVNGSQGYVQVDRSPTFPHLSPQELSGFVTSGIADDETAWIIRFRRRVREAVAGG
jgi:Uma2 family endonuclease